jgi:DNA-binding GntR family transcriptional regulator
MVEDAAWLGGEPMLRVAAPLREQVTRALRQAILTSELHPGQRLVERELIDRLGVSRTTIREAIRELTAEGLVTVVPQKGAVVTVVTLDDARDLYEARSAIESLIVRRFTERASDQQVRQLKTALKEFRRATEKKVQIADLLASKDAFYDVLVEGSGSPVLANLLASLHARVSLLRATSLGVPGRPLKAIEELEAVADLIAARDAAAAAAACEQHIRNASATALLGLESSH